MVLIYITTKTKKEARNISIHLLKKRLIACSNIHPINSMYWWKGKLMDHKEFVIMAKTTNKHIKTIRSEVKKVHSYDTPAIIDIDVDANPEFLKWVEKEVK